MKKKLIFGIFKSLARLQLGFLYILSDFISFVLYRVIKYRLKVVRANLSSSFPEKSIKELKNIEKNFYGYLADQIVETLKLLHISDKEMKRRVEVIKYEEVNSSLAAGKNAVILMGHYGNWEWVQEISRYFLQGTYMASIYHPLNNKMWDDFFISIRSRWNAHILPMSKAPRALLSKGNMPWVCGFIADAYTWQKHDNNKIDFLNHPTWFITGPEEIGDKTGSDYFYLEMIREKRGHYKIIFHPIRNCDTEHPYPKLREFWKMFEKTIEKAPAYWLWSHKRWK